jgi:two-component system, chemotaxis family, chemotaxis protein CheY
MGDSGKILVIEDDELLREALLEVLTDEGHEARAVEHGVAALAELSAFTPDLIILDLMMPVMDGYQFRAEQRRRGVAGDARLLLLSATRDLPGSAARLAADAHIAKPFRLDEVLATVSALLDGPATA